MPNDGSEEIEDLPDEPASLRAAYRQAVRAMDANAHIAAAAMFSQRNGRNGVMEEWGQPPFLFRKPIPRKKKKGVEFCVVF